MDQQQRGRRNLLQNLFITLLSLTAVMLFAQTQLYSLDLTGGYRNTLAGGESSSAPASAAGLTAPVRVAVTGAFGRYGNLTLTTDADAFADPLGRRLAEALGSAKEYVPCGKEGILQALAGPSLYYDFLESLPLSILAELVDASGDTREDLFARRLIIAPKTGGGTALYLWDGGDTGWRADTAVSLDSLEQVIGRFELGGAAFALDSPEAEAVLDPCSLLLAESPVLPVLQTDSFSLENTDWLLSALGFNPRTRTRHTESSGTEIIMDGNRTLRIRPDFSVFYQSLREPVLRVKAEQELPTLREAACGAAALLESLLENIPGEAAFYLQSIRQSGTTTTLRFGYQSQGVPVRFANGGFAAEVTLTGTSISGLNLRLRQYSPSGEASLLLPLAQVLAVAAGTPGRELSIGYVDSGGVCEAEWLVD
ncbi:MAG: hypothetical protein HFG00_13040 [Oscillibacter sp.]|nr:hypothetical protein [Oscillibacter sp.]